MAQGRVRQGCVVGLLPLCLAVAAGSLPSGLSAQEPQEAPPAPPSAAATAKPRLEWGLEAKANFRNSPDNRFPVRFPFPPSQLPPGQTRVFEETVNAGSHIELSNVSLYLDGIWSEALKAHAKIDFLNLYERNPTSTASKLNVDEAWIRFGRETEHAVLAPGSGLYVKVGKFGKL